MPTGREDDQKEVIKKNITFEYLMSKEENQVLFSMFYLDLEHICHKIEDNLNTSDKSSI